ncbi:hypothetical protein CEK69_06305 [Xanthomonas sp. LMG 12462]|uniref:DUF2274 domain-containing protein n=1 Tax=Xanthomonas sp. LMG 12462 TaxID=1591134 RepID=UPI00126469B2|nr:DUF2274 domain-containing protein [Xanthomonas sp. LMG 12462]KAB7772872.1 hypothetical protein CEK69_06305 [Xanthomonas sp. LMG 12462]
MLQLAFACSATLKADPRRYAVMHAQTYGEVVDILVLIPHMLEAFIAGDLGFKRGTGSNTRSSRACYELCSSEWKSK